LKEEMVNSDTVSLLPSSGNSSKSSAAWKKKRKQKEVSPDLDGHVSPVPCTNPYDKSSSDPEAEGTASGDSFSADRNESVAFPGEQLKRPLLPKSQMDERRRKRIEARRLRRQRQKKVKCS
jgi:hypothetical protein